MLSINQFDFVMLDVYFFGLSSVDVLCNICDVGYCIFVILILLLCLVDYQWISCKLLVYDYLVKLLMCKVIYVVFDVYVEICVKKKIFLIDDSVIVWCLMKCIMECILFEVEVIEVVDGIFGFEVFVKYRLDVVFVDLNMIGLDGFFIICIMYVINCDVLMVLVMVNVKMFKFVEVIYKFIKLFDFYQISQLFYSFCGLWILLSVEN